jgi:aconitate hydratase
LALTFRDPADYDRVRDGDRVSLVGLAHLAPGEPVACILRHRDGTVDELLLAHSYGASQLGWFRAGSALNALAHASS